jgi:hypothetical protein
VVHAETLFPYLPCTSPLHRTAADIVSADAPRPPSSPPPHPPGGCSRTSNTATSTGFGSKVMHADVLLSTCPQLVGRLVHLDCLPFARLVPRVVGGAVLLIPPLRRQPRSSHSLPTLRLHHPVRCVPVRRRITTHALVHSSTSDSDAIKRIVLAPKNTASGCFCCLSSQGEGTVQKKVRCW